MNWLGDHVLANIVQHWSHWRGKHLFAKLVSQRMCVNHSSSCALLIEISMRKWSGPSNRLPVFCHPRQKVRSSSRQSWRNNLNYSKQIIKSLTLFWGSFICSSANAYTLSMSMPHCFQPPINTWWGKNGKLFTWLSSKFRTWPSSVTLLRMP